MQIGLKFKTHNLDPAGYLQPFSQNCICKMRLVLIEHLTYPCLMFKLTDRRMITS